MLDMVITYFVIMATCCVYAIIGFFIFVIGFIFVKYCWPKIEDFCLHIIEKICD